MRFVKQTIAALGLIAFSTSALASTPQIDCLTRAIHHEARGETPRGQLGVAYVILNRTRSGRYPNTPCRVVTQRGQFSNLNLHRKIPTNEYNQAQSVAIQAVNTYSPANDPTHGALFFFNQRVRQASYLIRTVRIGLHVFAR